jgi:hypothetical protein
MSNYSLGKLLHYDLDPIFYMLSRIIGVKSVIACKDETIRGEILSYSDGFETRWYESGHLNILMRLPCIIHLIDR